MKTNPLKLGGLRTTWNKTAKTTEKQPNNEEILDRWFSRWIRLRNADENGFIICITCGRKLHWKQAHCGHYVKRGHQGTRYHEQNCGEQCPFCNTRRNGEEQAHRLYINHKYGEGTAELLKLKGKAAFKMLPQEYEEKISHYKDLVKANPLFSDEIKFAREHILQLKGKRR